MRKGIAVSQIVLLVIGILVLALVTYLLYVNFFGGTTSIDIEKCRSALIAACVIKKANPDSSTSFPTDACKGVTQFGSTIDESTCSNAGLPLK